MAAASRQTPPPIPASITAASRLMQLRARYAPSHLVVSAETGLVRFFDGPFAAYLTHSAGIASLGLFSLLRDILHAPVRDALMQAEASGEPASRRLLIEENEPFAGELTILVEPLASRHRSGDNRKGEPAETLFVVAFHPRPDDAALLPDRTGVAAGTGPVAAAPRAAFPGAAFPRADEEALRTLARMFDTTKQEMQAVIDEFQYLNAELIVTNDRLSRSVEDYRSLLDNTLIPTLFLDRELRVGSFTNTMTELFALRILDIGRPITDLSSRLDYPSLPADVQRVLQSAEVIEREVRSLDAEERVFLLRVHPHRRLDREAAGAVLTFVDITARKRAENQVWFLAHHDQLTALPNRAMFRSTLETSMSRAAATRACVSLLYLDLDHFKATNDTFGHRVGDGLLRTVATRLLARAPDGVVCRLGGDEFGIIETSGRGPQELVTLADAIHADICQPFEIESHLVQVGVSIGIASSSGEMDADALTRAADIALYEAKARGRGSYSVFQPSMEVERQRRRSLEADLRGAIARGELSLVYQPIVRLADRRIIGAEALLRWRHPRYGMLPPAQFIPLAEETGLIVPIGAWVLETGCADAASWPEPLCLSVNLSSVQFASLDLVDTVCRVLDRTGLPSSRLALEMTETVLLLDNRRTKDVLAALRRAGVSIVMDDFGTGYSSLSYIHNFELQKIKIDKAFIQTADTQKQSAVIVRAILTIGEGLGVGVCAEGVETESQLAALRQWGVPEAQGYFLHRPTSSENLHELLRQQAYVGAIGATHGVNT